MSGPLSLDTFDRTVADIYEAALDPSHWEVALAGIVNRSAPPRWDIAFLIWERLNPASGRFVGAFGVAEHARQGYLHFFAGRNLWSQHAHALPVGTVAHTDTMLAREEFRQSDLYTGFLGNWDIDAALIGVVDRSGPEHLGLVLPGPECGPLDHLHEAVRRYVPHIKRATRISRKLGEANLRAANAELALDSSPSATFVLGADLELLHANAKAQALLADGYGDLREGRLRLRSRAAQAELDKVLSEAAGAPSSAFTLEPDDLVPCRMLAMRIAAPMAQTLCGSIEGGRVLLVGSPHPGGVRLDLAERYMEWFGLTPAEARLAALLAQGESLEDSAISRGVSINAERFLLKGVFAKTGATKQAQLVAMLRDAPDGWITQPPALN